MVFTMWFLSILLLIAGATLVGLTLAAVLMGMVYLETFMGRA